MPRPLKIAQVTTADISIWILLWDQIQALRAAGHQVQAVCALGPFIERIRAGGVEVHNVRMTRRLNPVSDPVSFLSLCSLFRREKYDVVHTHTPKAGLLAPLAARLAGTPHIIHTIHGLLFHDRMPLWKRALFWVPEKVTALASHRLLSQSSEDVEVAVRTCLSARSKIRYLGNGINIEHFHPLYKHELRESARREFGLAADDFVVGAVGRLVREKGFAELLSAVESLTSELPTLKLLIVGPEEPERRDTLTIPPQQKGSVIFTGWRDDVRSAYAAMDIFALPSHREGVPRAAMEAAAMGLPVISSDIRGCREVVQHEITGLLVPLRDSAALAAAIRLLHDDPDRRRTMGGLGRRRMEQDFNAADVLARLLGYYSSCRVLDLDRGRD